MLQTPTTRRPQFVNVLAHLRKEWQEAARCHSLLEVDGNMGMLLADLINGIGLGIEEQLQVLEADLHRELRDFLPSSLRS